LEIASPLYCASELSQHVAGTLGPAPFVSSSDSLFLEKHY